MVSCVRFMSIPNAGDEDSEWHWPQKPGRGLIQLGFSDALLWVLKGNHRAERFYLNDGWSADGQERTDVVWGATVEEIRYIRHLPRVENRSTA